MISMDLFGGLPEHRQILLSYGGGKDSTAMIAMDLNRDAAASYLGITREVLDKALPVFDRAVFSDPGAEFGVTYQTIDRVKLELGARLVITRREGETIAEWCHRLGIVPIMPGGAHVCSKKFKGDVLAAWAKAQGITEPVWLIGIEANEGRRAKRFTPPAGDTAEYRYPLIDLGLTREDIDGLLVHLGWPNVHKSSCTFCPYMAEWELRDMYWNHPEEWAQVAEIERRFKEVSRLKHQAWIDAGEPLNSGGRAPPGMWRKDSWAAGARLFAKTINGRRLSVQEWAERFENLIAREAA
ncbi:3'-phosphoadenosine 5'-phosphosulfate sulfotransferase (PAPS reductase)/FAD synthetase [Halomonas shengliensis]|uniref:3'-phosphoadenosine 5'-phosphosulfate sulfotransferase (PAPS reductase)/FAD synthetase n=1 Tax=Halomonas shengliensis TaxID=419597 RepID=A0A1H0LUL6_9GAMM|nr:hypothetical protein [Halomonas shengliensis]SDO71825.1 3'-phosphoadenosine 5'-phosphosulfate sulfotransferase (PAPS reductase)/FAD synthetase [Halomonas shengliensis]